VYVKYAIYGLISKFWAVAMFVIVDTRTVYCAKRVGRFIVYLRTKFNMLSPSNRKLKTNFAQPPFYVAQKNYHNTSCIFFQDYYYTSFQGRKWVTLVSLPPHTFARLPCCCYSYEIESYGIGMTCNGISAL
jgi:hypothetical protein